MLQQASFKITLDVPSELVALSNMPIVDEKVNGPTKTVFYQESPIMSTYLVAVVVGLFDYLEDHTADGTFKYYFHFILHGVSVSLHSFYAFSQLSEGVKVRVYTQVGKKEQGNFALHVAAKTLDLYKEYVLFD